ncbi:hypothetical protein DEO72_LG3g969 [Vigna unguiculata]|uniref:Uncharacterized protein n=1 Tax=Vigna unguiculata TaxID=3917 RepID=A0A4D6LDG8_VIGUN|nr:hypothetical protein DEO72_LG3g969 [Vigna unguiculata]
MLRDASKNNFTELLVTVNTTLQPHKRFPENPYFNALRHEIKDVLLKLAIRAEQMFEDLSQLMNHAVRKATLEDMVNRMIEMVKMNKIDQKRDDECRHTKLAKHINFAKDVADKEIKDSHTNISTDGYVDTAQCEYKIVPVDEDMSTNDHFQEQSCEDNTMEEPSAIEEPIVFGDAAEASTIATDLVNDEAVESTTPGENSCLEDEIMRIIDDPLNHLNASNDAQVELKPHTPHIKFVDVNDAKKFLVVIFVDMAAEKEERLLQQYGAVN